MSFRALVTDRNDDGSISSAVRVLDDAQLPDGDVTVDIEWAGVNYKDGLCLTGGGALVRTYPHVAGIDFAGSVRSSVDTRYKVGDKVVLTGWRVGEVWWGGYAERARVRADWLVPLPAGFSTRDAMIVGTAGMAAMQSIMRLEDAGLVPGAGEVLVTGAAGGVGSIAISLLARLGHDVVALSGRPQLAETLRGLGASSIIERNEFLSHPDRPLESARWAAAIDNVGGKILGKLLKQVKGSGAVAAVGNAGGIAFETSVLPFIMRGITLIGIDSVMQPFGTRMTTWDRLVSLFDLKAYEGLVEETVLEGLPAIAKEILAGKVQGRLLVKLANALS